MFDALGKLPIWQRVLLFFFIAAGIVAVWYFLFYLDAVAAKGAADTALVNSQKELADIQKSRDNFDAEQKAIAAEEKQLEANREVLPLHASTVDNLMQTFQQQSRLVGMTVESWTNEPEELADFYARMPIKVQATGTWSQVGEFFRRVSELKRIVSVDGLSLALVNKSGDGKDKDPGDQHPALKVEFEAATYRFLTDAERDAAATAGAKAAKGRRKK
ncbi:MAG TPA: type 4a pilus biogenesis protein PilO [Nannocystaceae bacterium]|nr:type 4a pilus biogenesis protein PilO [Nannocystaceae bacterium]